MTTTTDFATRSADEAKTHELLHAYLKTSWSPMAAIVGAVFRAMHHSALPVDRVAQIGAALAGYQHDTLRGQDLTDALTAMTKAKVLRSRSIKGVRHYEVNY